MLYYLFLRGWYSNMHFSVPPLVYSAECVRACQCPLAYLESRFYSLELALIIPLYYALKPYTVYTVHSAYHLQNIRRLLRRGSGGARGHAFAKAEAAEVSAHSVLEKHGSMQRKRKMRLKAEILLSLKAEMISTSVLVCLGVRVRNTNSPRQKYYTAFNSN